MGSALAGCPPDDTYITGTTALGGGLCNVSDPGGDGVLIIQASNIFLDCNGTVFNGSMAAILAGSIGLKAEGLTNVTVFNCTFQNYASGVYFSGMQDSSIERSNMTGNLLGIGVRLGSDVHLRESIIDSNFLGGAVYDSCRGSPVVYKTNITNNSFYGLNVSSGALSIKNSNISYSSISDIYSVNASVSLTDSFYVNLMKGWLLAINITNASGEPIETPLAQIFDVNGKYLTFSSLSHDTFGIAEYIQNSSGTLNYTPHTINVSKAGYVTNSTRIYLTQNLDVRIALKSPAQDIEAPGITHSISPQNAVNGSQVTIHVDASDDVGVDRVWAVISHASGQERLWLNNLEDNAYLVTRLGRHNVTIFANDTSGNESSVSGYFISAELITFSVNVTGYNNSGISSILIIYEEGTSREAGSFSSAEGVFKDKTIANWTYDLLFRRSSGDLQVTLMGVELWENPDREVRLHALNFTTPEFPNFVTTYAVETTYSFTDARVRMSYQDSWVDDEDNLNVYVCGDWDFPGLACNGQWAAIEFSQDRDSNYMDVDVHGFSAFSINQEGECETGDTRPCSENYQGACSAGTETCTAGAWTGCQSPLGEWCNSRDDDCNGIIDDVGGGDSVNATGCGCYNGAPATREILDDIDNDCDGQTDEGCLCREGETDEEYGSNHGVCRPGTIRCVNCVWDTGNCEGCYGPFEEICGNDLDDDCDAETDEQDCIFQTNMTCGYGLIPKSGCMCEGLTLGTGYCCNDKFQMEPCPEFPWWILIVAGIALFVGALVFYMKYEKKKEEMEWERLRKRYTPAK